MWNKNVGTRWPHQEEWWGNQSNTTNIGAYWRFLCWLQEEEIVASCRRTTTTTADYGRSEATTVDDDRSEHNLQKWGDQIWLPEDHR